MPDFTYKMHFTQTTYDLGNPTTKPVDHKPKVPQDQANHHLDLDLHCEKKKRNREQKIGAVMSIPPQKLLL